MSKAYYRKDILERALHEGSGLQSVLNRGTGKTTSSILSVLSTAIRHHGTEVVVANDPDLDGHFTTSVRRDRAQAWVRRANDIVKMLDLKEIYITIDKDASVKVVSHFADELHV